MIYIINKHILQENINNEGNLIDRLRSVLATASLPNPSAASAHL